jgi:outer membrane protein OmpA-like peptidoglycan-associated protein
MFIFRRIRITHEYLKEHMMSSRIVALALMAFLAVPTVWAQQQGTGTQTRSQIDEYSRPQEFGFGAHLGLNRYAGDLQDGTKFPGATTTLMLGGGVHALWRFAEAGDFATVHLGGRLTYSPQRSEWTGTKNDVTGTLEYNCTVWHANAIFELQLFPEYDFRPFGFVGIGYMAFTPSYTITLPGYENRFVEGKTNSATLPMGLGLVWTATDRIDLSLHYEKVLTFTDEMDRWVAEENDNYNTGTLGVTIYLGDRSTAVQPTAPVQVAPKDSDNDGLMDNDETAIYNTNPNNPDTDGDGLTDGDEVRKYQTDPTNADTDNDGLKDGAEVLTYHTDPKVKDSDQDGCIDGDEVLSMKTDPIRQDTDGDKLSDCDEVNVYRTNPLIVDTDGDSVDDGTEVRNGTDPLVPDVLRINDNQPIILEGILFKTNSADIEPESEQPLQKALNTLKVNPNLKIEIQGHTDDVGNNATNMRLSQARANSVRDWLVSRGIDPNRLTARGYGEDKPLVPNTSQETRSKNRRIQFDIIK